MTQTPIENAAPIADSLSTRINEMAKQIPDLDDKVEMGQVFRVSTDKRGYVEDGIIRESPLLL